MSIGDKYMSENELREFIVERIRRIEESQLRLEESVDKRLEGACIRFEKAIEKTESIWQGKFGDLRCREQTAKISQHETTLELIQDNIRRWRSIMKGVLALVGSLMTGIIIALVKIILSK